MELGKLLRKDFQIESFFEGCRLLQQTAVSLEGYLLKPIQVSAAVTCPHIVSHVRLGRAAHLSVPADVG